LSNSDEACEGFNTTAKLDPPLSSVSDVKLLIEALKNAEIDVLTTLHQPSSPVNKEVAFYDAGYGCEALSDAMPLYYTKLVKSGLLTMSELVKLTSQNPAKSIGIDAGEIKVGSKANAFLFDSEATKVVENEQSLYNGQSLSGSVIKIF